jgi:ASC-1-like (ASCH) protein
MMHDLKCWPQFFSLIEVGLKTFEVRKDDRKPRFEIGDTLLLREWDPSNNRYTGSEVVRVVTYVLRDSRFMPDGTVVMAIVPRPGPAGG